MSGLAPSEPLDIYFNSGGGDVWAGIAIHNILKRHSGHKRSIVDGMAASIASVILMAGDEIIVNTGAQIMVHKPWCWTAGNADELLELADKLDGAEESMLEIYMTRAKEGVERETLAELLRAETWMDGSLAQDYFDVTLAQQPAAAACASLCYARYRHMPTAIQAEVQGNQPSYTSNSSASTDKAPDTPGEEQGDLQLELGLAGALLYAIEKMTWR